MSKHATDHSLHLSEMYRDGTAVYYRATLYRPAVFYPSYFYHLVKNTKPLDTREQHHDYYEIHANAIAIAVKQHGYHNSYVFFHKHTSRRLDAQIAYQYFNPATVRETID